MTEDEAVEIFRRTGALRENGHFRLSSGFHANTYVDFDVIPKSHRDLVSGLCQGLAARINEAGIRADVVVAPSGAAEVLAPEVAHFLGSRVVSVIACKVKNGLFVLDEETRHQVAGSRVLLVDDVVSSGGTFRRLAYAVREAEGEIVAQAALWLRDLERLDVIALIRRDVPARPITECEKCRAGVPIDEW